MRIFAKKAFEFRNDAGDVIQTRPLDFTDVPDWVGKARLFQLAVQDGSLVLSEQELKSKAKAKDRKKAESESEAESEAEQQSGKE